MTGSFRAHIRSALENPGLQAALDANAEKRIKARLQAYASLPEDIQVLRQRAHAVRAEVIEHLDRYLDQFIARAEANGIVVHRAADARQAVEIVLDIAVRNKAKLVAKSKTMVGEEIELNQALEGAGLRVVETDLGEYIVQLRGERPAHIITPAVHLQRGDVGWTFHEKLGLPLTDDIPTLTAAARRILRQTFLEADIGVSGVNFGVAESGGLCILTNEGNGRMITTLPAVHIALMGIERLVRTFDDLALMLALLPRSATGQKLTVYTSLIHSPSGENMEGPGQRHLVLVDNGRSAIRRSSLAESLYCIRCGACLNACPVFREIGGHAYVSIHGEGSPYQGPIGSVISAGLFGQSEFGQLARASSLCGACKEACPVDIDLPRLLLRVRAGSPGLEEQTSPTGVPRGLGWGLRLYSWIAMSPARFAAAQRLAGIAGRLLSLFSAWLPLPAITGWGYSRDFPRPAAKPFRKRWNALARKSNERLAITATPTRDGFQTMDFTGASLEQGASLITQFEGELTALGVRFTCCETQEVPERILNFLREREISSLLAWEGQYLPPGLLEALQEAGVRTSHRRDAEAQAGLTGALAGVAETGTLVLPSGLGKPPTASLLPPVHIVLLRAGDIYANLAQVLNLPEVREAPAVAFITGPSRTADIEMTLTIGVHGPGEVHVFCFC